jgi:hypothetical protein
MEVPTMEKRPMIWGKIQTHLGDRENENKPLEKVGKSIRRLFPRSPFQEEIAKAIVSA